jgi:hypothetical protein
MPVCDLRMELNWLYTQWISEYTDQCYNYQTVEFTCSLLGQFLIKLLIQ